MLIKEQNFGVEIEVTGITREEAIDVIASYFGTSTRYLGGVYKTWQTSDRKNRAWKAVRDASILTQRKLSDNTKVSANEVYSCEIVTPILQYDDIDDLQQIVRNLREAGAFANSSTGIHIHVDGARHNSRSLQRLINFAVGRQDLFYEALRIGERANHWCRKMSANLLRSMKNDTNKSKSSTEKIWYSEANDDYRGGIDHQHYNSTRYRGVNLHAFFTKGTVEFRLFNGTTHAGKIKAYIQFCLAMSAWAIETNSEKLYFKSCAHYTQEQKAALMKRVLVKRLGMKGKEFRTARYHLTSAFLENVEAVA